MLAAETSLVSIGEAARLLGTTVNRMADAATELGIRAAERRDGVAWLRDEQLDRIRQHLAQQERR
jgi:hypothetical protein